MRAIRPVAFPVPTVNLLFEWYLEIVSAYQETVRTAPKLGPGGLPKLDAVRERLVTLAADYPEAQAHCLLTANLFAGGVVAIIADDPADALARLKGAAVAAYQAAK